MSKVTAENAHIVTCTALLPFIEEAQRRTGTSLPVHTVDRIHHVEPERMQSLFLQVIGDLPPEAATVLIGSGFCGGIWEGVTCPRRLVIPRTDDCVSALLTVDENPEPNKKESGHLYLYENDPADFSALKLMRDYGDAGERYTGLSEEDLFHYWFDNYRHMDIIDTSLNDCYSVPYVEAAQAEADRIGAALDYRQGSIYLFEKMLRGIWDEQFVVGEAGDVLRHGSFF